MIRQFLLSDRIVRLSIDDVIVASYVTCDTCELIILSGVYVIIKRYLIMMKMYSQNSMTVIVWNNHLFLSLSDNT